VEIGLKEKVTVLLIYLGVKLDSCHIYIYNILTLPSECQLCCSLIELDLAVLIWWINISSSTDADCIISCRATTELQPL